MGIGAGIGGRERRDCRGVADLAQRLRGYGREDWVRIFQCGDQPRRGALHAILLTQGLGSQPPNDWVTIVDGVCQSARRIPVLDVAERLGSGAADREILVAQRLGEHAAVPVIFDAAERLDRGDAHRQVGVADQRGESFDRPDVLDVSQRPGGGGPRLRVFCPEQPA